MFVLFFFFLLLFSLFPNVFEPFVWNIESDSAEFFVSNVFSLLSSNVCWLWCFMLVVILCVVFGKGTCQTYCVFQWSCTFFSKMCVLPIGHKPDRWVLLLLLPPPPLLVLLLLIIIMIALLIIIMMISFDMIIASTARRSSGASWAPEPWWSRSTPWWSASTTPGPGRSSSTESARTARWSTTPSPSTWRSNLRCA